MSAATVRCPSGRRVPVEDCHDNYVNGNAHVSAAMTKARYLRCRKCGVGAGVRADLAAEGDRIGSAERGWRQELREAMRGCRDRSAKCLDTRSDPCDD